MYEINLIGDIDSEVKEGYVNDKFLATELEEAKGQDLEIKINTLGGCVYTAFRMYDLLEDYKIKNKAVVTTITDQNCASSGIILLLAGNRRIVNNNTNPFIHEAWMEVVGTANYLLNSAFDLEDCNFKIAKLYAQKTALDYEEARELMGIETFFTPEESYNLGFATELSKVYNKLDYKLIIKNKLELKTNINMTKEEKSFFEMAKNFFLGSKEEKSDIKNKVVLTVADVEIDFMEIDTDVTPKVGDKANVDGKPAEGEYITKGGEKYSFEGGVLTEIEKEEDNSGNSDSAKNKLENKFEIVYQMNTNEKQNQVYNMLKAKGFMYPWITALYDTHVVFQDDYDSEFKRLEFNVDENNQVNPVGEAVKVFNTFLTQEEIDEIKTKETNIQNKINELTENLKTAQDKNKKFDDLNSEFQKLDKKEQRETKEVLETKEKFNFSQMKNNLKQIKNN